MKKNRTSGANSPINTGDGNQVNYGGSSNNSNNSKKEKVTIIKITYATGGFIAGITTSIIANFIYNYFT